MGGFISYSSPSFLIRCDLIAHTIVMSGYIISPYMGDSPDIWGEYRYTDIMTTRMHFSPMYTSTTMFQHAFLMNSAV